MPFGDDTLVFRVGFGDKHRKIFALISTDRPDYLLLKCDPARAITLRDTYIDEVEPGWHMNKRHWNGVYIDIDRSRSGIRKLTDAIIYEMIDHSYSLVYNSLPKSIRETMEQNEK